MFFNIFLNSRINFVQSKVRNLFSWERLRFPFLGSDSPPAKTFLGWDPLSVFEIAIAGDEQRREELKNFQTIVLDLEELKQLHLIAKRPRVRSILSREITILESTIVSNSTESGENAPEEEEDSGNVKFAKTSSKRKRKGRGQPDSLTMKKKPKRAAIEKPFVNGSSCKNMEEEQHLKKTRVSEKLLQEKANLSDVAVAEQLQPKLPQYTVSPCPKIPITAGSSCTSTQEETNLASLPTRASEQVLSDKVTSSGVNEVPSMAVAEIEKADVSKGKPNLGTIKEPIVIVESSSESTQEERNQPPLPTGNSEPVLWENANTSDLDETSPTTQEEPNQASLPTRASEQVLSGTTPSSGVNEVATMAVAETEKAGVSKGKPNLYTIKEPIVLVESSSESTQEEPNQHPLPTGNSEPLWEKANPSDLDEASPRTSVATENAHVSNKISQTIPLGTASSRSELAESARARLSGTCLTCHEMGHFTASCPKKNTKDVTSPSAVGTSKVTQAKVKGNVPAHVECFYCKGSGHFKRTCPKYLIDLKYGNAQLLQTLLEMKKARNYKVQFQEDYDVAIASEDAMLYGAVGL